MSTATATLAGYDADALYRAVASRDRRFDGRFVLGVTSTGIYCRPSCPARTPKPQNVRYFAVPAAAVAAGFRACRRCRPDRVASRPHIADETGVVDRALTLISQGVVDEVGVSGLATKLSVSERHLHRLLVESVGAGASALAQTRRAQTARTLLEQTGMSVTDVGYASGFGSLRQFNDVIRAEYGASPSELRRNPTHPDRPADAGSIALRLPVTVPWDGERLLAFLAARAIPGVESSQDGRYARSVTTPDGSTFELALRAGTDAVQVEVHTSDVSDVGAAVPIVRRLCDLAADVAAIETALASHELFAPLVRRRPGLRVPGMVSGWEALVRAVIGQQISVAGARTLLGRLVKRCGTRMDVSHSEGETVSAFPSAASVAEADLDGLGLTGRRVQTLRAAARLSASGDLPLDPGDDVHEARRRLLAIPGIGPWTAEYVGMRALADPDAWPGSDLVLARAAAGVNTERLRPWRAYAAIHLWTFEGEEKT